MEKWIMYMDIDRMVKYNPLALRGDEKKGEKRHKRWI
jgi:hypothetical protein